MAKFLFTAIPVTGHVNPGLPIARELVRRGHDVRFYSSTRFRKAIEATGARWVPVIQAMPIDEERMQEMYPERPKAGIRQLQFDIRNVFVDVLPGMLRDVEAELDHEPADVIVADNTCAVAGLVHERRGIPWAVYGILPLGIPSRDTAPFGLGLLPGSSPLMRLRNRALYWLVDNVIFRAANVRYQQIRRELGLPRFEGSLFGYARGADLYLQSSVAAFEYPRTDMPENLRFIGATVPAPPSDWTPPSWWDQLDGKKVVLVTQGTINNNYDELIRPAIRALANSDTFVVVTTGSRPASAVEIDPLPENVRVERFIPYAHLMPKVDLLLTNGGYGSVQIALAHGVPVVAIGATEDKPEIANRVQWSGVGIGIRTNAPGEKQIRLAVTKVLSDPSYAARAEGIRYQLASLDAPARAAEWIEELAGVDSLAKSA